MSLRLRLLVLLLAIYCAGGYFITTWTLDQVRPRYLESMEESLVDTSVLLASVVEGHLGDEQLATGLLGRTFEAARFRKFEAQIYTLKKTTLDLRVYVTDAVGKVVFDSAGRDGGRDFSRWNDVARTLRGQYGARATSDRAEDEDSLVFYVAAPIRQGDRIVGVLSVGKPTWAINDLVNAAQLKIRLGLAVGGVLMLGLTLVMAAWVIGPLERLTVYARAVRDGRPATVPTLPGRTLRDLATAFEEMRDSLEGRQHVERYTQALAHEVKAPLAAIRGAAELLQENMPGPQREKFLGNIRTEGARIQQIIERLLELSSLEARKALRRTETIAGAALLTEAADILRPAFAGARVTLEVGMSPLCTVRGEQVLLREALVNLLQNALDFSSPGSEVTLNAEADEGRVVFVVEDRGAGVPDYALARVFERFYSLARPGSARKSTGLGLALVREIMHLHGGDVTLENRPDCGVRATIWLQRES